MKIFVFGNIGSGKTRLCKGLEKSLQDWEYLAVDDFRRSLSDGSMKGDSKAKSAFVRSITHDDTPQIIESSGFGRVGSSMLRRLQKYKGLLIIILLRVNVNNCLERLEKRIWDVPFPQNTTRGNDLVLKMEKLLNKGYIYERWGVKENTVFLQFPHNNEKDTQKVIETILQYLEK